MSRFLGGVFGNTVPSTGSLPATTGVYDLNGQYYVKQEGGWLLPFTATGGTTQTPGNGYKYHVFNHPNSDNFTVTDGSRNVEAVIVAGGGGSTGPYGSGGAGGGGVVHVTTYTADPGTHPVTVGDGGAAVPNPGPYVPADGENSSFNSITALGGGSRTPGNPAYTNGAPGGSGGAGGGTATQPTHPQPIPAPSYSQYGSAGGGDANPGGQGGGGGAGAAGSDGPGGAGGDGQPFSGFEYPLIGLSPLDPHSPSNNHYGGGGGGWGFPTNAGGPGGSGGGGRGTGYPGTDHTLGIDNLGGGAGGWVTPTPSPGNVTGGSGIVILRYLP